LPFDECRVAVLAGQTSRCGSSPEADFAEKCVRVLVDAVSPDGLLAVNLEDPSLASIFAPGAMQLLAVANTEDHPFLKQHAQQGGLCAFADDGDAVIVRGDSVVLRWPLCGAAFSAGEGLSQLLAIAAAWAVRDVAAEPVVPGADSLPRR